MKIIIVGCGKVGMTIVQSLCDEGHDLVCIDDNPEVVEEIGNIYDVMTLCGNGVDCDILSEAEIEKCELFVAVTGSDELNMLSCFLAKKMGAAHTVARIRNPEYNDRSLGFMRQQLSLTDSINPEFLAAREMYNILKFPSAVNIETFSGRNFEMIELKLKPDSELAGLSLSDMRKKYQAKFLVCAVQRGEEASIPGGSFRLAGGDKIGLTASPAEVQKLLKMMGILQKRARSIIILGASRTAYYLAKLCLAGGHSVKIIEQNKERCAHVSELLPGATIICGDGASQELLFEEGIADTDAFVSLTGMDEENILISCFAAAQKVPTVITKVNRPELVQMAEKLGLDIIISPKRIVSGVVTRYARALQNSIGSSVETLYKLMDGKAEALEFSVREDFAYCNIPLRELTLKPNILFAGIVRGRTAFIPAGDDVILPNDRVVILASAGEQLQDLSDVIRA